MQAASRLRYSFDSGLAEVSVQPVLAASSRHVLGSLRTAKGKLRQTQLRVTSTGKPENADDTSSSRTEQRTCMAMKPEKVEAPALVQPTSGESVGGTPNTSLRQPRSNTPLEPGEQGDVKQVALSQEGVAGQGHVGAHEEARSATDRRRQPGVGLRREQSSTMSKHENTSPETRGGDGQSQGRSKQKQEQAQCEKSTERTRRLV